VHATYTPPPGHAACPDCAQATSLVLDAPALDWASFWFRCPACGCQWKETRQADTATRFWSPRRAVSAA
jgi:hypothetical protein